MAKCPGQDQRFWKPEDIFEIDCPECGISVEFWKDEPQVKCPNCKHSIVNPKLDLACAEWCQYAEECLGMVNQQKDAILSNKLIQHLRQIAGTNKNVIRKSLEILRYAERILVKEKGDPFVVKASAILSQVYNSHPQTHFTPDYNEHTISQEDASIRDILGTYGIDNEIIDHVCLILDACQSAKEMDSIEFNVIYDSFQLLQLHESITAKKEVSIDIPWRTETGRQLAEELYRENE